ncbi:MAG: hypothetical protein AAGG01_13700, partial [Planctomycetota bacterium]
MKPPERPSAGDQDPALEESLAQDWDARLIGYDEERFPFRAWIEDRVRALGFRIESLETLHETVSSGDVYTLTKDLCAATRQPDFVEIVRRFVSEVIALEGRL